MSEVVIQVRDIRKKYNLGSIGSQTFFTDVKNMFGSGSSDLLKPAVDTEEEYWALKGISFDVKEGEVLGIVGRNGAGKSTLLKVLSRVTAPTSGRIDIKGRIASLLEVGTGFHPDLSGRDNIFLNGAILGMRKAEIASKLEEIVSFSGIEKYIDTPVKRYSSGMYVRLAFAVAAHLEPEILIIDEVLAVGDAEFQRKCIGKMKDVSKGGRTVLFVSHNMSAINSLCDRTLYLKSGLEEAIGDTSQIIKQYLSGFASFNYKVMPGEHQIGDNYVKLISARLIKPNYEDAELIEVSEMFGAEIIYEITQEGYMPGPNFLLSTQDGERIFQSMCTEIRPYLSKGVYKSMVWFPANFLNDSAYKLTVAITTHNPTKIHFTADINFQLYDDINSPTRGDYKGQMHGVMRPLLNWEIQKVS